MTELNISGRNYRNERNEENNDASTDLVVGNTDDVKGLDANRYATKKTVAQGMLDIALLTSNASQLKYVLQVGQRHEFYYMLLVLISLSIILQVASAIICGVLGFIFDINHGPDQRYADILNNIALFFRGMSTATNVVLNVFYSIAYEAKDFK